ncbi:MAG: acyltransferase family protein, partial [Pseudomonadota bacterium]
MNPRLSAHLDLLRVLAALVVLFSHFAYARFSRGDYLFVREWNLGSDAVVVFFVLSGYVVAHTAARPGMTFGRFAF